MKRYRFHAPFRRLLQARLRHLLENCPEGFYRASVEFARLCPGDGTDIINLFTNSNIPWFSRGHSPMRGRDL